MCGYNFDFDFSNPDPAVNGQKNAHSEGKYTNRLVRLSNRMFLLLSKIMLLKTR